MTCDGDPDARLRDAPVRLMCIQRCSFAIMVPEHYRPDGSCRCDDPDHRAMMIREWEYMEADFASIPLRKGTS